MITATTHKRKIRNGSYHVVRVVSEEEVFNCKFCGKPVTWFKSEKTSKVYPVNCFKTLEGTWKADVFLGMHKNSSPPHKCLNKLKGVKENGRKN